MICGLVWATPPPATRQGWPPIVRWHMDGHHRHACRLLSGHHEPCLCLCGAEQPWTHVAVSEAAGRLR